MDKEIVLAGKRGFASSGVRFLRLQSHQAVVVEMC